MQQLQHIMSVYLAREWLDDERYGCTLGGAGR